MSRPLSDVTDVLQARAPLEWAEPWDNVGLLVQPAVEDITSILLTIDLTESVLAEAQANRANLIVAYHPIIFSGLMRLTRKSTNERIVIDSIRAGIAIYSPHTALDAAPGGMNDWLVQAIGSGKITPIVALANAPVATGLGRLVELDAPKSLDELLPVIRQHLGLSQLRVAAATQHANGAPIRSAAVCAGAGGSVFQQCPAVDLLLTGEMRHHDILSRVAAGTSVILADHTNTERGYLAQFATFLREALGLDVAVHVSSSDREPLQIR